MKIYSAQDYQSMSRKAANILSAHVILKPGSVLGLATGSTPIGMYKQLIEWYNKGDIDFSQVHTVNLDEYLGLAPTHEQSYRYFMQQNLFDHIDIKPENTHVLNGLAADPDAECAAYDQLIRELGGVDLQLLGMGHNGHIGFNEPADEFVGPTHVVELAQSTIDANKRFFASEADVPRQALTMGMAAILQARSVVVVVSGEDKAEIVHKAFFGPITPRVPASLLQLHPNVTVVGDEAAFSVLRKEGCL